MPPTAIRTRIANTGYSAHRLRRLCSEARVLMTMKTTNATSPTGQIQERMPIASVDGCAMISPKPTKAIDAAGTRAHRCG